MKVTALTCTNGRFSYLQRLLGFFLAQEHENKHLIIFNNATTPIRMKPIENVTLINCYIDYLTGLPYTQLGSIFRDALSHAPADTNFISIMDDDDIYFPKHFSTGAAALSEHPSYKVWRPKYNYRKVSEFQIENIEIGGRNLEAACIIDFAFLKQVGFIETTSLQQHFQWLKGALHQNCLYEDDNPNHLSFCWEIGQKDVFHTGIFALKNPQATKKEIDANAKQFNNYGEGQVLEPWSPEQVANYYRYLLKLEKMYRIAKERPNVT